MNTPIADFVRSYIRSDVSRLHMPGHKGRAVLGCEDWDITEVSGADSLYEADGIIDESESNAAVLFGSRRTFYSTEGSSQCIKAMLYLAVTLRRPGSSPVIAAARNVHRSFISAAALIGFDVKWIWPEGEMTSVCACPVSPEALDRSLNEMDAPPAAVYVTSPDYLGNMQDITGLAAVCHEHGTILAVDNAHGAYLHFCDPKMHPLDLGADICCDSAHKTLPVLTGGAYLHMAHTLPACFEEQARSALALFGSTSPSYLTLCSLDMCNAALSDSYSRELSETILRIDRFCKQLADLGWQFNRGEPLKVTIHASQSGIEGHALAKRLRASGVEMECVDRDDLVLMITPMNPSADLDRVIAGMGKAPGGVSLCAPLPVASGKQVMTIREAMFAPKETVSVRAAKGRVCAAPTVSCPPAIPIVVPGETVTDEAIYISEYYGMDRMDVVCGSF